MFKAFGNLIHRTPWWGMILGGIATLAVLVLFTLPVQVIRLVDSGATPAENRAIQREIGLAVGSRALDLATGVITTLRERVTTPERRDEFERALAEIERARVELLRAQSAGYESVIESAREAADSALETATSAAESALDAAVEARQAVEEARADAIERLRDKGVDVSATLKSMEQLVASARENEQSAREALNAMRALQLDNQHTPPAVPGVPSCQAFPVYQAHRSLPRSPPCKLYRIYRPSPRFQPSPLSVQAPQSRASPLACTGQVSARTTAQRWCCRPKCGEISAPRWVAMSGAWHWVRH
jgi:hypothetical protein